MDGFLIELRVLLNWFAKYVFFEELNDVIGAAQKVDIEQTTSALSTAAILRKVTIGHPEC